MYNKINPLKQGIIIKQFLGWFIAVLFPFTAKGLMDYIKNPYISVIIYFIVCGVLLRYLMDKKLPYFNPQIKKVKREIIVLVVSSIICEFLYINMSSTHIASSNALLTNLFLYGIIGGCFEQLVWINIFELAGAKSKIIGSAAAIVNIALMYCIFWGQIMPLTITNNIWFILAQLVVISSAFTIYIKTNDITIWSIQHIICNLISIFYLGFGTGLFLYFH